MQTLASGSEFLTELSTSAGAGLSDWLLTCLATACPHLKALRLQFSTVSDSGVPLAQAGIPPATQVLLSAKSRDTPFSRTSCE